MAKSTGYERHTMIRILKQMSLEPGGVWFIISRKWYQAWEVATAGIPHKEFANATESTLGPVDNSDIVRPDTREMLLGLVEGYQFELLPEEAWKNLVEWYGQPSIALSRNVVAYPTATGLPETRVEVYHPEFFVFLLAPESTGHISHARIEISSNSPLSSLIELVASTLGVQASSQYRLWNMPPVTPKTGIPPSQIERGTLLPVPRDDSTPLTDFGRMGRVFALEICGTDGQWPLDAESVSVSDDPSKGVDFGSGESQIGWTTPFPGQVVGPPVPRGTMGLQNLGHTCFMNAGLQCLLHIPELERYFLENLHLHELNPNNPLSTDGKMATAFNIVVHQFYPSKAKPASGSKVQRRVGSSSSYAARNFHDTLCGFAPVFAGYEENDSQELIGMVLDSLHEDLNRILKKPYVERPDWPEEDLGEKLAETEARIARETWEGHVRRNDSIIADLFHGMYKSTLSCLSCGKVSITFEPFVSLALPLPAAVALWRHTVHFVPWDVKQRPLHLQIELSKSSSTASLKEKLGSLLKTKQENLLVAEVWKHKFFKFFDEDADITEISNDDMLVVYELPIPATLLASTPQHESDSKLPVILPVIHTSSGSPFGLPLLIVANHSETSSSEELSRVVAERSARWTKNECGASSSIGFNLKVFNSGGHNLETGFRLGVGMNKLEDLASRKSTSPSTPLVNATEALVCDWHPEAKEKIFSRDNSLFDSWEPYSGLIDPSSSSSELESIGLDDCLDELTKMEHLGSSNSWYCSRCKQHRPATKQLQLWATPNILILQIKRFAKRHKIDELVTFPIQGLDLSDRIGEKGLKEDHVYDLFAVDEHRGGNLSTGAYSTYAKNESDGVWYNFFDAKVSPSTPQETINPGAYLLFYRRRTASVEDVMNKAKLKISKRVST